MRRSSNVVTTGEIEIIHHTKVAMVPTAAPIVTIVTATVFQVTGCGRRASHLNSSLTSLAVSLVVWVGLYVRFGFAPARERSIADHKTSRIDELPPWRYASQS